jgi:uncharacterized membrane protein YhiD involved in acid resistance
MVVFGRSEGIASHAVVGSAATTVVAFGEPKGKARIWVSGHPVALQEKRVNSVGFLCAVAIVHMSRRSALDRYQRPA